TDTLQSAVTDLQGLGSAVRQIDNPARDDRSPVVDPDHHGLAVAKVRDLHEAANGKLQVRRRHIVHLVRFAAGGRFSFELIPVPRSRPNLIRLYLGDLLADFGSCLNRTTWSRFRLRDVRSLSRS